MSSSSTSPTSVRLTLYWHMPPAGSSIRRSVAGTPFMLSPTSTLVLVVGPDGGELLLAAQADVALLGRDLERAERGEGRHQLLVDRPQAGLGAGVDGAEHVVRRGFAGRAAALLAGLEIGAGERVGVAVAHAEVALEHLQDLAVLGRARSRG